MTEFAEQHKLDGTPVSITIGTVNGEKKRDTKLYVVELLQRYQGYFGPGADDQMLSMKLCGPTLGNDSVELVADWSKADIG